MVLSSDFNITIDRMISAPGYLKDFMDTINACDKIYLKEKMHMVGTPEADDSAKIMKDYTIV